MGGVCLRLLWCLMAINARVLDEFVGHVVILVVWAQFLLDRNPPL